MCGIYYIQNLISKKGYVGQSKDIQKRWNQERSVAFNPNSTRYNSILSKAFKKYKLNNFNFSVLKECDFTKLDEREIYWIKEKNTLVPNGYNILQGGQSGGIQADYDLIKKLWDEGKSCKEIQKITKYNNKTITKCLHIYYTENEIRGRSQWNRINIIAYDAVTNKPLKHFNSAEQAGSVLNLNKNSIDTLHARIIKNAQKIIYSFGYKWGVDNDDIDFNDISEENFLLYRCQKLYRSDELKYSLSINNRKVERPSRQELKQLIRIMPFTEIGKKYSVTDNAIRKWCDFYHLPRRVKEIKQYSDAEWVEV